MRCSSGQPPFKIYTKTGDDGTTGLGDGSRTPKDSPRVNAYGTVDELNSAIGMVLAQEIPAPVRETLTQIQHDLFDLGGELCIPGMAMIHDADVTRLESTLDGFNADLPRLKEFILPGGNVAAAMLSPRAHRVPARRAQTVTLARTGPYGPRRSTTWIAFPIPNFFVLSRVLARAGGMTVLWNHERRKRKP